MSNWKKLITSGSDAILSSVTASSYTGSFTGSLFGTSSWAVSSSRSVSSSFAISSSQSTSASYALSASYSPNTTFPYTGSAIISGSLVVSGTISSTNTISSGANITATNLLQSMNQAADEGGEIFLNQPATNTTIAGGVTVDVYQDKFRIFEQGGANRGFYLDIPSGTPGAGTDLKPAGYTGTVTLFGNPPPNNLNFVDGILISVT